MDLFLLLQQTLIKALLFVLLRCEPIKRFISSDLEQQTEESITASVHPAASSELQANGLDFKAFSESERGNLDIKDFAGS